MKENPVSRWWRNRQESTAGSSPGPTAATTKTAAVEPIKVELIDPQDYVGSDAGKNERIVRDGFLDKAKRYLRYMPMAEEVVAAYFCMLDGKTPLWVKGTVAAALAYFILPLDAIPDVLPIIGLSDDTAVITAALTAISAYITEDHHKKACAWLRIERVATKTKAPAAGGS